MINYQKQKHCIAEMRSVLKSPIKSLRLLCELKNKKATTFEFVGYLNYYLHFAHQDIYSCVDGSNTGVVIKSYLNECWHYGFVNDTQKAILMCAANIIDKLIKRYYLIYIFL